MVCEKPTTSKRFYVLVEYFDPAPIDRRLMTAQEVEQANKGLQEEAWFDEIEYYEELKEKEMGKSEREERQKRKQGRVDRDKEGHGFSGSYVLGKHGFDFEFHKPDKSTTMKIHILPFLIKTERHPEVAAGRMEIGDEDYFLEYGAHRGIGPDGKSAILCLDSTYGKPCPICEHARELKKKGDRDDLPWPSRRVAYNVMEDEDDEVKVFDVSEKLFHRELKSKLSRSERGFFDYSSLDEGAMIQCYVEEDRSGKFTYLKFKDFEFKERKPLPRSLLDRTFPLEMLLNVPEYDDVLAFYNGEITSVDYKDTDGKKSKKEEPKGDGVSGKSAADGVGSRGVPPREEAEEPKRGAREAAREETKEERPKTSEQLKFGDKCPYGLVYGKDHDTDKRKCGIECPDKIFGACKKAMEGHEQAKG